jgi:hypothetical protein
MKTLQRNILKLSGLESRRVRGGVYRNYPQNKRVFLCSIMEIPVPFDWIEFSPVSVFQRPKELGRTVYVCRMGKTRNNYRILMENFLKTAA